MSVCGYTLVDSDGDEYPCDRPASSWRWYQDVEHEDCLAPACDWHANEGGRRLAAVHTLVDEWRDLGSDLRMTGTAAAADLTQALTGRTLT